MKKLFLLFLFFSINRFWVALPEEIHISVDSDNASRMPLFVGLCSGGGQLKKIAKTIKKDFEFSGQFDVFVEFCGKIKKKSDITRLYKNGYLFALFLSVSGNSLEWRLYDTQQGDMIKGKVIPEFEMKKYMIHMISNSMWPELTGQNGFFTTQIAYSREVRKRGKKRGSREICKAMFNGDEVEAIVSTPTVNIAPRWSKDKSNPVILYSEHTKANLRLMAVNIENKRRWVASNFRGMNMLPTFSGDGKSIVLCLSKSGKSDLYLHTKNEKTGKHLLKRLTVGGNNISPCMLDDGSGIYFCSDFKTRNPQVYFLNLLDEKIKRITNGGYCVSPSYSSVSKKLVYAKMVKGTLQVFIHDPKKGTHEQITFNRGNKEECSWSPCGNFLIYCEERNGKGRVAIMHIITRNVQYITPYNQDCSYPSWSPIY